MLSAHEPAPQSSMVFLTLSFPQASSDARDVHVSNKGLDEAQYADEDSFNYNSLYYRACTV